STSRRLHRTVRRARGDMVVPGVGIVRWRRLLVDGTFGPAAQNVEVPFVQLASGGRLPKQFVQVAMSARPVALAKSLLKFPELLVREMLFDLIDDVLVLEEISRLILQSVEFLEIAQPLSHQFLGGLHVQFARQFVVRLLGRGSDAWSR